MNTPINMKSEVNGITILKTCSVRPFKDSPDFKIINLAIRFNGIVIEDVFNKAVKPIVISWQQLGRKNYDKLTNKETITIDFKSPGKTQIDPVGQLIYWASALKMEVGALATDMAKVMQETGCDSGEYFQNQLSKMEKTSAK